MARGSARSGRSGACRTPVSQRKVVPSVAAALDVLEPEVPHLGHFMERAGPCLVRRRRRRHRRQGEQLPLDLAAQAFGVAFLRVGRPDRLEDRHGVAQMTARRERPRVARIVSARRGRGSVDSPATGVTAAAGGHSSGRCARGRRARENRSGLSTRQRRPTRRWRRRSPGTRSGRRLTGTTGASAGAASADR